MNGSGCVFEYCGKVPCNVHAATSFASPLEEAVYRNDLESFMYHIKEGHVVSVGLKIGQMSCIEYAAMKGYADILLALLDQSVNANILRAYFSLPGVVDRAYLLSTEKTRFFEQGALAEVNRCEAALYTAVEYDQPESVAVLLQFLGSQEPNKHYFNIGEDACDLLSPSELATVRGHEQCLDILNRKWSSTASIL